MFGVRVIRNISRLLPRTNQLIVRTPLFTSSVMGTSSSEIPNDLKVLDEGQKPNYPKSFDTVDLRERLSEEEFHVTQERGTERAFTGQFWKSQDDGRYSCIVCGAPLFHSSQKFLSGCGWPAFSDVVDNKAVTLIKDSTFGMDRIEATCSQCGAHLGHLFFDGPTKNRQRFCINSASIKFTKDDTPTSDKDHC